MWALVKTIELGVEKMRLVNLSQCVKIRATEETDGDYHKKHGGKALVFLKEFDVLPTELEKHGIVGELQEVMADLKRCDFKDLV